MGPPPARHSPQDLLKYDFAGNVRAPAMREYLWDWGWRFTWAVTGDADGETRWSAARPEP